MKEKSLNKNALLNSIRTVLKLLFPLVAFPYATHVLNVESIGIYNYVYSIIAYFLLISKLGISTFAIREGSKYRNDIKEFSLFSSKIFTINILSTILSYLLLIFFIIIFSSLRNFYIIFLILSFEIILTTFGCEWIYIIKEDYTYITIRTILFQLISLFLLFFLVKDSNDLYFYCIVMLFSKAGSNILNLINLKKIVKLRIIIDIDFIKLTFKPILILFANSIATSIYVNSDITLLGIFRDNYSVGIYSTSTKIYTIVKELLAAIIIVSIPRLSYLYGKKEFLKFKELAESIIIKTIFITLPAIIGMIVLSKNIIYIIAGKEYIIGNISLVILSIALLFSLFSWFYTSCILIPSQNENKVLIATVVSSILNILLNILLIPKFSYNATAFTTLLSELVSMILCIYFSKKIIHIKISFKDLFKILIGSLLIFIICHCIKLNYNLYINTFILVIISVIVYFLAELLLKNKILIDLIRKQKK